MSDYTFDPDLISDRNPTGIKLSQKAIDESNRASYWRHAIEYGLQYYVAGRFAVVARFTPVCATLLHHAVELLLKACLAKDDSVEPIWSYGRGNSYGHSLGSLWSEFRRRNEGLELAEFDDIVAGLDAFENIRYPDRLVKQGAEISIGLYDVPPAGIAAGAKPRPEPRYELMLPRIDRLVELLLRQTNINPLALQPLFWSKDAATYLRMHNPCPFEGADVKPNL